ncbi:MAG: exo-alpha-sialidase [Opitutaceae bacterium]|nr:exo-alpha-sialidase [Opitutaceae bacterium]
MRIGARLAAAALALAAAAGAAESDDPALEPATVNAAPGAAYGPDTRRFQGIPGITRSPGGRLWAAWYTGGTNEGPDNYVALVTSGDDGRTWSELQVVIDPPGYVRAFDPALWTDPRGRVWLFYGQAYGWWDGRGGVWAVVTDNPDAPAPRWSAPRRIADGVMMNKPTVRGNGDWLLPIAVWRHRPTAEVPWDPAVRIAERYLKWDPARTGTHVYGSRDAGTTFAHLGSAEVPDVRSDEHMIVERRDGSLWMLVRAGSTVEEGDTRLNRAGIAETFSTDGGRTWSRGRPAAIPHIPSRFFIRRLASGRLLLVKHNPRLDSAWLQPDVPNGWQRRSHLTAYLSDDDGRTWSGGLVLDERLVVSYPDAVEADDGRIFLVYDYNRKTDKQILLAVFTEADVAAGRLVDPRSRLRQLINQARGQAPAPAPAAAG